jgi:hypothetical protein
MSIFAKAFPPRGRKIGSLGEPISIFQKLAATATSAISAANAGQKQNGH